MFGGEPTLERRFPSEPLEESQHNLQIMNVLDRLTMSIRHLYHS
jgi:hypothetical protein